MSTFADSSALVKLYADEPGHKIIRELDILVIAVLARVEVPAAIWRKHRSGELDAGHAGTLVAEFEADYCGTETEPPRFVVLDTPDAVLDGAARLCAVHGLRAYDAIQLGAAVAAHAADPDCASLAAFDADLRKAAGYEGFTLVPAW